MGMNRHSSTIAFAFPGLVGIRCVFTTRYAGNLSFAREGAGGEERPAVLAARQGLAAGLGLDSWAELRQVHGDGFCLNSPVASLAADPVLDGDGHATDRKNHALCIKTADCQPILLAHPKGCVAAVHAGWRGNVLHFPRTAVAAFCRAYSLDPAEVRAVRGPSLGYAEFVNFDQEWPPEFAPWYNRTTHLMDLWGVTRAQLQKAGLRPENIYGLDLCTYSLNDLFFSHRRGDTGRQAALIWS